MKRYIKILLTLTFTTILLLGFAMPLNPAGNWYQQFMPNIGGRSIQDIIFFDSLTGIAISSRLNDTSYILRTNNSGDNWIINRVDSGVTYNKIKNINQSTGFIGGYIRVGTQYYILKTTNAGINWYYINAPSDKIAYDMSVISDDTLWIVDANSLVGGVYRTTNGGASWDRQLDLGNQNPDHVYFYNGRIGFIGEFGGTYLRKTTNSGINWTVVESGGFNGFSDMYFVDSLTGFRAISTVKKTTDGGLNWINQVLPQGGQIITSTISKISVLNRDTVWGVGGEIIVGSQSRGIIYRTINGGQNWTFQIPDTAIYVPGPYNYLQFANSKYGWAYTLGLYGGIHTILGGDPIWLTPVEEISTEIPEEYRLFQNYPNPFNPTTNIKYSVKRETSNVRLIVFDVQGKQVSVIVNQKQSPGTYEVDFSGNNYSSGIYFYSLIIDGNIIQTKKMTLLK